MAIYTLRPNLEVAKANTNLVGVADASVATSDNNDSSWAQLTGAATPAFILCDLGNAAVSASEIITRVRIRSRHITNPGTINMYVMLEDPAGWQCVADYYTSEILAITTFTGAWRNSSPDGGPWTTARVNALRVRVQDNQGSTTKARIVELYVDVETNFRPVPTATGPNATLTDTATPTWTWTYADTEGDTQQRYRVKVFTAAQVAAAGFDPNTSVPYVDSGEMTGAVTSWTQTTSLEGGAYRGYIFVADAYQWSAVTTAGPYATATIAPLSPGIPTLTAAAGTATGGTDLGITGRVNMLSKDQASVESSLADWIVRANCTLARLTGQSGAPNGTAVMEMTSTNTLTAAIQTAQGLSGIPCLPNTKYTACIAVKPVTVARGFRVGMAWDDSAGALAGFVDDPTYNFTERSGEWVYAWISGTTSANAAYLWVVANVNTTVAAEKHQVDAIGLFPGGMNLLKTPTFSVDANGDGVPDDWFIYEFTGPFGSHSLDPTMPYMGSASWRAVIGTNLGWKGLRQPMSLPIGRQITISAWVRLSVAGSVGLYCPALTGGAGGDQVLPAVPANQWTRISLTGTAVLAYGDVYVRTNTSNVTAWFGAAQVEVDNVQTNPLVPRHWVRGGFSASEYVEIQRSYDKLTWSPIKRLTKGTNAGSVVAATSGSAGLVWASSGNMLASASDLEAKRGVTVYYRARQVGLEGVQTYPSDWSNIAEVVLIGSDWWLKSIEVVAGSAQAVPDYNVHPNIHSEGWSVTSTERQGVFQPLGRKNAAVLSGVIGGERGTLTMAFLDQAGYDKFVALRARRRPVLLQNSYGEQLFIRFGADRTAEFMLNQGGIPKRVVSIPFTEVDEP